MQAKTLISVDEYLRTSFDEGDRDYVDGEVLERNVGEYPHGKIQWRLGGYFWDLQKRAAVYGSPEIRIQVSPTRYRVADFAIYAGEEPSTNIPTVPPLVVVEVASREDRLSGIFDRLQEYRDYGVANVWLVDPWRRKLYTYDNGALHHTQRFELPEFDFRIEDADLFVER